MYKIMSNNISDINSIKQIEKIDKIFNDNHIVIMPDFHGGKGCVIGTTMLITDKVCPNHVGVDIGCGILGYEIDKKEITFDKEKLTQVDSIIRNKVPHGKNVRSFKSSYIPDDYKIEVKANINDDVVERAYLSLGSLGSGNHFIEIGENKDKYIILIHSGSRNFGLQIAKYYQEKAIKQYSENRLSELENIINNSISEDREKLIAAHKKAIIPDDSCYLVGEEMQNYLDDIKKVQEFAMLNRRVMLKTILDNLSLEFKEANIIESMHNYIDEYKGLYILRKGATSAKESEKVIISLNMRDGTIIGTGKGNKEWNYSAPHGAGRILSRTEAKKNLSLDEFKETMKGIFTTCVSSNTLDESPMAYKPMEEILRVIGDTIEIEEVVKPIYNFKAN